MASVSLTLDYYAVIYWPTNTKKNIQKNKINLVESISLLLKISNQSHIIFLIFADIIVLKLLDTR